MKKIFLALIAVIISISNVNAETKYSDYIFVEYSDECNESETVKCEEVKFNKYYLESKLLGDYYEENKNDDAYPFKDENDFIYKNVYLKENNASEIGLKITRMDESDLIDEIKFFVNNSENFIKSIEIYENGELLNSINNNIFDVVSLKLNTAVPFNSLGIKIDYDDNFISPTSIPVDFNFNGQNYLKTDIVLESGVSSMKYIYMPSEEFETFIKDNSLAANNQINRIYVLKLYESKIKLYRYFDIKRDYYSDSDLILDGYSFNEDESYTKYKVYKRDVINTGIDKMIPDSTLMINPKNSNTKEKVIDTEEKSDDPVVPPIIVPSKKIFSTSNSVKSKSNGYAGNTLSSSVNTIKKKLIFTLLFIILLIIVIRTLHHLHEKQKSNNVETI